MADKLSEALFVEESVEEFGHHSRPIVITANEDGLSLFFGDYLDVKIKFDINQWARISEFVDTQILRAHESKEP